MISNLIILLLWKCWPAICYQESLKQDHKWTCIKDWIKNKSPAKHSDYLGSSFSYFNFPHLLETLCRQYIGQWSVLEVASCSHLGISDICSVRRNCSLKTWLFQDCIAYCRQTGLSMSSEGHLWALELYFFLLLLLHINFYWIHKWKFWVLITH